MNVTNPKLKKHKTIPLYIANPTLANPMPIWTKMEEIINC